ncbi:MAG: hypothetical protein E6P95_01460 [Candidatus Moraniibacteriota bacterium]|nr:MAG: hypothetical protein E6P95_01460 [Candidatus Moranbacteria bacterium]
MEQRLQLNKVTQLPKKGEKLIVLELTDVQLHTNVRPTKSIGGVVERSIDYKKPGRINSPLKKPSESDIATKSIPITLPFLMEDPSLKQAIHKYQQQGYRVMLKMPKEGLPIYLGKDAVDFMKSTTSRRLLRKIKRDKNQ